MLQAQQAALATLCVLSAVQVWPYLKPLRKWIRKQQRNNPEGLWDMPQITPPAQQREMHVTPLGSSSGAHLSPLPQHVQQLAQLDRRSGTGSPKHMLHSQFHEAAIAQARQQAAVSSGPQLPPPGAAASPMDLGAGASISSRQGSGVSRPLAQLFAAAATQQGPPNSSSGTSIDVHATGPGSFTFNRQSILHALASPAVVAAPIRQQISGRV